MPPDPDLADRTRQVYRDHAGAYAEGRTQALFERPWLDRFVAELPRGGAVLDVGCGIGQPIAGYLISQGLKLTGLDASPQMLAHARRHLPQADFVEADMRTLDLGRTFDGLIAWDSFFHLTPGEQRSTIPRFAAHLSPGGALLFTSGPRAGEASGQVDGQPVYHASLQPAEYAGLLESAGMELRAFIAEDADCDRHSVWLARKPAEGRDE